MLALFAVILGFIVQHTSAYTGAPIYKCSCQCPYGSNQGIAYTTENSVQGCGKACMAVPSNPCQPSNTYACLGTNCAHWQDTSVKLYKCSCRCPMGTWKGEAYATVNSNRACGKACIAVPSNGCTTSNANGCINDLCTWWDWVDEPALSTTSNQNSVATGDVTVPAGETYYNNVVLNGNAIHIRGIMKGRITGHGTIHMYNGARLDGDLYMTGDIEFKSYGSVTIGGQFRGNGNIIFGG